MKNVFKIKRDKYKSARGGSSKIFDIYCRKCNTYALSYQKDGVGSLIRLYLDRIIKPLNQIGFEYYDIKSIGALKCGSCASILGIPYTYTKEKRSAYRLIQNNITKKKRGISEIK